MDDYSCDIVIDLLKNLSQENNSVLIIVTHDKRLKYKFKQFIDLDASLAWNNIIKRPFSSGLSVLLLASSIMIVILAFLTMQQIESKFNENANKIDLVVGAKGSRLQLFVQCIPRR